MMSESTAAELEAEPRATSAAIPTNRSIDQRSLARQVGWFVVFAVVAFLVIWPIFQLQRHALSEGLASFRRMFELPRIGTTIRSTFILAAMSTAIAVVAGTFLAWCAATLPTRLRKVGQVVPLLPLVVPAVASVTGWTFLLSPTVGYINTLLRRTPFFDHLVDGPFNVYSLPFIVLITAMLLTSFVYLYVHTGLRGMGEEYEAAAAVCGGNPLRRFWTVTLPLLRPSIVHATGIVFLLGLGQFTVPLLLGRSEGIDVLTTEMFRLTLRYPVDFGLGAALGTPLIVIGVLLVLIQRRLIGEQRRFVVVSGRSKNDVRQSHWWSGAVIVVYAVVTTVLPLLALLYVSFSPFWSGNISFDNLTTRHYGNVFSQPHLTGAIWTSVRAALAAVLIVIPLGFACAYAALRTTEISRPLRGGLDVVVSLPIAIPASLFGFGMLFAYTRAPFELYGTSAILIVAYVTLMIPHGTRLQFTSLVATGQEFREASRACGAGPVRTFFYVLLPMARKGMGAAAAIMFVLLFHEFSASLMVRSVRTQVMGSVLYDVWTGGIYPQVAVMALIMVAVTLFGVGVAVLISGSDSLERM